MQNEILTLINFSGIRHSHVSTCQILRKFWNFISLLEMKQHKITTVSDRSCNFISCCRTLPLEIFGYVKYSVCDLGFPFF